jgi:hypothetical protein
MHARSLSLSLLLFHLNAAGQLQHADNRRVGSDVMHCGQIGIVSLVFCQIGGGKVVGVGCPDALLTPNVGTLDVPFWKLLKMLYLLTNPVLIIMIIGRGNISS